MFDRLTADARDLVVHAVDEAELLGERRVGTEHLLIGVLFDPEIAAVLGVDAGEARAASQELDMQALAAIGLDLGGHELTATAMRRKRPMLGTGITSGARSVFPRAFELAQADKSRRIAPKHLCIALLERESPDSAAALLAQLKVDRKKAAAQLAR